MAARIRRIKQDPKTIEKIKCGLLVKKLTDHVLYDKEMLPSQITAALGLIKKVLPDQAAIQQEISGPEGNPIEMKWEVEVVEVAKATDT